jgi:hypothetical protein
MRTPSKDAEELRPLEIKLKDNIKTTDKKQPSEEDPKSATKLSKLT